MRRGLLLAGLLLAWGCGNDAAPAGDTGMPLDARADTAADLSGADVLGTELPSADAPGTDVVPDLAPDETAPTGFDIADLTFGEFQNWASPIEDYIAINTQELGHENFMKEIFDLAVFEDRLYFGYGDANLNLGRITPIEVRYWSAPDPAGYAFDFVTDEEQIDRFRQAGERLMIPGVDATEDAFLGNAYTLMAGGEWVKSRTLDLGWHVHDMAAAGEAIYACGSGGTGDDYENSTVNALLWRSTDGGDTFELLVQSPHPAPPGDHRLVHLLALGGEVYVFGYYTSEGVAYGLSYRVTEEGLEPWEGVADFFVTDSFALSTKAGLLAGVRIQDPLVQGVMRVTPTGATPVDALDGYTLLDAEPLGDGRAVLLAIEGDSYPLPDQGGYTLHVFLTTTGADVTEIAPPRTTWARPVSIAFWRDSLYLGMSDGTVQRAQGTP